MIQKLTEKELDALAKLVNRAIHTKQLEIPVGNMMGDRECIPLDKAFVNVGLVEINTVEYTELNAKLWRQP